MPSIDELILFYSLNYFIDSAICLIKLPLIFSYASAILLSNWFCINTSCEALNYLKLMALELEPSRLQYDTSTSILLHVYLIYSKDFLKNSSFTTNFYFSFSIVDFIADFLIYFFQLLKFFITLKCLKKSSLTIFLKKFASLSHYYNGTNRGCYSLK